MIDHLACAAQEIASTRRADMCGLPNFDRLAMSTVRGPGVTEVAGPGPTVHLDSGVQNARPRLLGGGSVVLSVGQRDDAGDKQSNAECSEDAEDDPVLH